MAAHQQLTILIVDDYEPHTYALRRLLEKAGFEVLTASTGTEALKRAALRPDLVILDIGLPDVNGFEVCRRIKANSDTKTTPVVLLSATHQSQRAVEQGEEVGADCFLFHPVEFESLLAVIRGSIAKAAYAAAAPPSAGNTDK
jgi:DNA-binding response OmpR family regulator